MFLQMFVYRIICFFLFLFLFLFFVSGLVEDNTQIQTLFFVHLVGLILKLHNCSKVSCFEVSSPSNVILP